MAYALPGELLAPADKAVGVALAQSGRLITTFLMVKVDRTMTFRGTSGASDIMFIISSKGTQVTHPSFLLNQIMSEDLAMHDHATGVTE